MSHLPFVSRELLIEKEDAEGKARLACRLYFLRIAAKHPDIKLGASLRKSVFEVSMDRWVALGLPKWPNIGLDWIPEKHLPLLEVWKKEQAALIQNWAGHHNLAYQWVYEATDRTLSFGTFPKIPFNMVPAYGQPYFLWPPWRQDQTEDEYRSDLQVRFLRDSEKYIRAVAAERARFIPHRTSQESHYSWAAECICLRRSFADIAKRTNFRPSGGVTRQAVYQAVHSVLQRIDIPSSRQAKPGKQTQS
jgi:hypothetical protein